MFGFVVANPEKLSDEQNKHYKAVYCGICEELGENNGFVYRMALTYDLVFLAIVLSSVYSEDYVVSEGKCPIHPTKKRAFARNKFTRYASDMNIALAYYKYIDDKKDESNFIASLKAKLFQNEVKKIVKKYPLQCNEIKKALDELEKAEKADILIPDIPASIFGRLLGNIFAYELDCKKSYLYDLGFSLGKFIYLLDAAVDLKKDIKQKKYNPLIMYSANSIKPMLEMVMAECVEKYKALDLTQDKEIIENILFSGVWTVYDSRKKGQKSE